MTTKHTPGPWKLEEWEHDGFSTGDFSIYPGKGTKMPIATIQQPFNGKRTIANARLIAASPDLLEFANMYIAQFCGHQITNTSDSKHDATGWLRDIARAAIDKATGVAT